MSLPFDRLLAALRGPYDTDPQPIRAVRIATSGVTVAVTAAGVQVAGATLPLSGSLADIIVGLQGLGVQASLLRPELAERSARLLLDSPPFVTAPSSVENDLYVWTNPLWVMLRPLGMALEDRAGRMTEALAQLQLLTATGYWADTWGTYLNISRRAGETDSAYTARMKSETLRVKDNNRALEAILASDLGVVDAEVTDLLPLVLIWNETSWHHYWPGALYTSGAFMVTYRQTGIDSRAVLALLERYRAAGTRYILHVNQEVRGTVVILGRIVQGPAYVWDGRAAETPLRARVHAGPWTQYDCVVSLPLNANANIAVGADKLLTLAIGDVLYATTVPQGTQFYALQGLIEAAHPGVFSFVLLFSGARQILPALRWLQLRLVTDTTACAFTHLGSGPVPGWTTEVPLVRQPRWVPGETAFPGSVIAD